MIEVEKFKKDELSMDVILKTRKLKKISGIILILVIVSFLLYLLQDVNLSKRLVPVADIITVLRIH